MSKTSFKAGGALAIAILMSNCSSTSPSKASKMVVSVADQRLVVFDEQGAPKKSYPVSTSKFGLGDRPGSKKTPIGKMIVREKVGGGARSGTVFKGRKPTGEVIRPNSPGRDPIVSRILWLGGGSKSTQNAYRRYIYIHGTAEEWRVGEPASYGCIRMRSKDVIDLYDSVGIGSAVYVKPGRLYSSEVPSRDQMIVNNSRRSSPFGMGSGEVLAAASPSTRPPVRRTVSKRETKKPKPKTKSKPPRVTKTRTTRQVPTGTIPELSQRRGIFDR